MVGRGRAWAATHHFSCNGWKLALLCGNKGHDLCSYAKENIPRGATPPRMPLIRSQIIKQLSTSRDREIRPRRLSCDMSAAPPSSEPAVQGIDDNRLTIIASQAWLLFNLLIHGNCQHTIILILQVGENFMDLDVIVRADTFSS